MRRHVNLISSHSKRSVEMFPLHEHRSADDLFLMHLGERCYAVTQRGPFIHSNTCHTRVIGRKPLCFALFSLLFHIFLQFTFSWENGSFQQRSEKVPENLSITWLTKEALTDRRYESGHPVWYPSAEASSGSRHSDVCQRTQSLQYLFSSGFLCAGSGWTDFFDIRNTQGNAIQRLLCWTSIHKGCTSSRAHQRATTDLAEIQTHCDTFGSSTKFTEGPTTALYIRLSRELNIRGILVCRNSLRHSEKRDKIAPKKDSWDEVTYELVLLLMDKSKNKPKTEGFNGLCLFFGFYTIQ